MAALQDPRFRRLVVAYGLSTFGDSALYITLGIWAKDITGSNAAAGLTFLFLGVPALLGPFIGQVVDRMSRRTALIANNLVTSLVVLSLFAVETADQLWIIYAVAFAYGLSLDVLAAARGGLIKDMVPEADLGSANATIQTLTQGVRLLSPLAGAALYTAFGGGMVAVLDVATFLMGAAVLVTIRVTESAVEPATESYLRQVGAGFRHIVRTPLLAQLALAAVVAFAVIGFEETVIFALVDEGLGRSPAFLGVLTSVQGGGAILGGLTATWMLRRIGEARLVGLGLVLLAAGLFAAIGSTLTVVIPAITVFGLAIPWAGVGLMTAVQRCTPSRLVGRTGASMNVLLNGPQAASIALGAVLITAVDYRVLLAVSATVIAAAGLHPLIRPASAPDTSSAQAPTPDSTSPVAASTDVRSE